MSYHEPHSEKVALLVAPGTHARIHFNSGHSGLLKYGSFGCIFENRCHAA